MQLTRLMVSASKYSIKCPYEMEAEGIAVHNTANKASAMAEVSYMVGNNNSVSFHYAIDEYRIVQGIEENRNAYHAGDGRNGRGNRKMISIEICHSTNPNTELFDKAERNAAKFIAYKLNEKGWGIDRVYKHQDFSKKYCPHKTLDLGWERFLNMIREELKAYDKQEDPKSDTDETSISYLVRIITPVLNVRKKPEMGNNIETTVKKGEVYTIVEESNGWGKLKSGAGWIKLYYTEKVTSNSKVNQPVINTPLAVGSKVKIKKTAEKYCTGQNIPNSIKGKTYTVRQIGSNKYPKGILLKEIVSWVYRSDLEY